MKDVSLCENYIACDDETQSEIVVPCFGKKGQIKTCLDIDSNDKETFDETDKRWLEKIVNIVYSGDGCLF